MLLRSFLIASVAVLAVSGAAFAAEGDADPAPGTTVKFCGPVVNLTEANCIGVESGGTTYDITGARPKPAVGKTITGSGKVSGAMTICNEAPVLTGVTWQETQVCTQ